MPIKRAEELLVTLPGVLSAKIVAADTGAVDEIHVLTTAEYTPKQTVRNIESALIAHLGMRVDHRKISVASSSEPQRGVPPAAGLGGGTAVSSSGVQAVGGLQAVGAPGSTNAGPSVVSGPRAVGGGSAEEFRDLVREVDSTLAAVVSEDLTRRRIYFEDVEVRRSRARGMLCRVTLRKGEQSYTGEAEGLEGDRSRVELAARAAVKAISSAERGERSLAVDGVRVFDAFEREFVFVGVTGQVGRERAMLTGSCEVRESAETAGVLAVLDATNRWIAHGRT